VIVGLALAGGRSSRFGREKALAEVNGRPMLAWTLDVLRPVCAEVAVSARRGSGAAALAQGLGLTVLYDDPADPEGPLAGIKAGLKWAGSVGVARLLTAPCDTPYLPADYAARLLGADPSRPAYAEVADEAEPLCAVWPAGLLDLLMARLANGHPSVAKLLHELGATAVPFEDAAAFRNVNRPDDL
jgi:molybdopterin-guanine dinucleotide biosynthesis protein A